MKIRTRRSYLARHQRKRGPWASIGRLRHMARALQHLAAPCQGGYYRMEIGRIEGFRFITSTTIR